MGQQGKKENVPIQRSEEQEGSRTMTRPTQGQPVAQGRGLTPFSFVRRMMEDMDRMFGGGSLLGGGLFDDVRPMLQSWPETIWTPQIEVLEHGGNLVVRADLPGLDKDDVRVSVDDQILTIEGERRGEHEEKREGYYHSERNYGSFQRRIALPRGVDASTCEAAFENGVLEIRMKLPQQTSRKVEIKGGAPQPQVQSPPTTQAQPQRPANGTQPAR